jgi:hypothetical protein
MQNCRTKPWVKCGSSVDRVKCTYPMCGHLTHTPQPQTTPACYARDAGGRCRS